MSEQQNAPACAQHLTPEDVKKRLTVSMSTLANWRSTGKGPPYIKLCGTVRYPLDLLVAWEASNIVQPVGR